MAVPPSGCLRTDGWSPLDRVDAHALDLEVVGASAGGIEVGRHERRSYRASYDRLVHRTGTWRCDFVATDADAAVSGGFVQLVVPPDSGDSRYWAYLVGHDVGIVAVRDHEVPRPRRPGDLTVRAEGLWAELMCETPDVHWTIGLEAFGVRLEEPADALHGEVGERIAVGLDLEWDEGTVFGDVLIGTDRLAFEGVGSFVADGATTWTTTPETEVSFDANGLPVAISLRTRRGDVDVEILGVVPIPFADGPGSPYLVRVLGRWLDDQGVPVRGWLDTTNSLAPLEDRGRR